MCDDKLRQMGRTNEVVGQIIDKFDRSDLEIPIQVEPVISGPMTRSRALENAWNGWESMLRSAEEHGADDEGFDEKTIKRFKYYVAMWIKRARELEDER